MILSARYRPATGREVRRRSYGAVKAVRNPDAQGWAECRGTLDDQAIFGPIVDFQCACGKYDGIKYQNLVCDICSVKATTRESRRNRYGHVELLRQVPHPFGASHELDAFPIMPAAIVGAQAGAALAGFYDELIASIASPNFDFSVWFERLAMAIMPIAIAAHEWNLAEAQLFAFGLALEPLEE